MTETAQLALIGVLGTFLTGAITLGGIALNLLMSRQNAIKGQIETATRKGDIAAEKADTAAKTVSETSAAVIESLQENTEITKQVHGLVNGERMALLAELAKTKRELIEALKANAAAKQGGK